MYSRADVMALMDLTSLNDDDNEQVIARLCAEADNEMGTVAAVCIYSSFLPQAGKLLQGKPIALATVVNFPEGNQSIDVVRNHVKEALTAGADEIDLVVPYQDYLSQGHSRLARELVSACKECCGDKTLKVIIESGALESAALIEQASRDAIEAGADFIKTSTGKISVGATLAAAEVMLMVISQYQDRRVGFKASGGVRTYAQALDYIELGCRLCDNDFIQPATFRFGASGLLKDLLGKTGKQGHY